jgi:hypothetical protein
MQEYRMIMNWTIAIIPRIQFALNFTVNVNLICDCYSEISDLCRIVEGFTRYHEITIFSWLYGYIHGGVLTEKEFIEQVI